MRVGFDLRLNAYRQGGIPQYNRQLLGALARLAPDVGFVALQHRKQQQPVVTGANITPVTLLTPPHHRLEPLALPLELLPHGLTVLHCPDVIAPRWRSVPAVVTIHDLAFLLFPEILDANARQYYGQVRDTVRHADAIIAVSQHTRADICTLLEVPPERVTVIYEAAAPRFVPVALPPHATRQINRHRLTAGTFALFVSTIEPRKNLTTLLRALRLCLEREPHTPYQLVIAGLPGWNDAAIYQAARNLRLAEHLIWLGGVSQADLHWLYNACRVYANPSLYEGFGLPVLEALACGAAVLAADTSSIPEVAGDAAMLLPATDVDAWAAAMERLWHDAALRGQLGQRGVAQAAQFSWQQAASETLAVYRRVVGMQ